MKKRTRLMCAAVAATFTAGSMAGLVACNKDESEPLTDEPLKATLLADFTSDADAHKEVFASGSKGYSWENGEPFNVWWKPANVSYEDNKMSLAISEMTEKEQKYDEETGEMVDVLADYYGAEARTEHYYGFGDFQVRMKPSAVVGTASTFFTCTGPYDKWYEEDGETVKKSNKHDEIDIEFLGKDTTKVQFNYFADGEGGHEHMYDLGFDASKEFHNYGFRWTENYITWFVDDVPVYRVDRPENGAWPEDPGRAIMNYWCGTETASGWMGEFPDNYDGRAEYEWIKTSAAQQPDPNTAHVKPQPPVEIDVPTEGWTDISIDGFDGWGNYAIDKTGGLTVSHDEAKSNFACCGTALDDSYGWVKFKIKNNDENDADIRIDLKKEGGAGAVAAVVSEHEGVTLNALDSALMAKIGGGEEVEIAVKIKDMFIDQMVVFLNSMDSSSSATGSITITGLQGIINDDVTPPAPVDPADEVKLIVGDSELKISGDVGEGKYTLAKDEEKSGVQVTYTDLLGKSYANINAPIASLAKTHGTFTAKLRNNGTETVNVRIDINSSTKVEETTACNVSAKQDGLTATTDTTYGGSMFTIAPGTTIDVEIVYDAERSPTTVMFYFDSSKYDDEDTHSGDVTIYDCAFSGDVYEKPDPELPPAPPQGDSVPLTFTSTEVYVVDKSGEAATTVNVTYTDMEGGKYGNIQTEDAKELAVGKDTFSLDITNNGEENVSVRVDLIGETAVGNTDVCNVSHTVIGEEADAGNTDTVYGGTTVTVKPAQTITLIVKFDGDGERGAVQRLQLYFDSSTYQDTATYSGDITVGNFKFGSSQTTAPDPVDPDPTTPAVTEFDIPTTGWEAIADNLDGWEQYTLERMPFAYYNGVRLIKKDVDSKCCGMTLAKQYAYFMFSVKNELGDPAEMRFDFNQAGVNNSGTVLAAMVDGRAVAIDSESAAALVTVPANTMVKVVVKLDSAKDMDQFVIFLNSLKEEGNSVNGRVVITDIRAIAEPAAETVDPSPVTGWEDISLDAFGGWDMYEVDKTDGLKISHTETRDDYNCCGGDLTKNYSWVKFSVTNNGTQTAMMRVDFKDKSKDSNPSFVSEVYPLANVMRVKEGKEGKDSYSAGIIVDAGETVDVVLKLDNKYFDQMVIFMNSLPDTGKATAGDITITGLKGIVDPGIEHKDPDAKEALNLDFGGHSKYTINKTAEGTNVKYSDVQLGSFVNMHAKINADAKTYNTLQMTVKNNGTDNVLLRVAICKYYDSNDNTKEDRNTCNTDQALNGPYYQDGRGGTYVVVGAGEEVTFNIKYTPQGGERDPEEVYIYIDSSKKDDGKTCSGDITFKEFALANT